jgi:predicted ATPase
MSYKRLSRLVLQSFKSIRQCDLKLGELNILIGANGAGKSNFMSFFCLLQQLLPEKLHLDITALESWLSEYSLGELWQKNLLGGGGA